MIPKQINLILPKKKKKFILKKLYVNLIFCNVFL